MKLPKVYIYGAGGHGQEVLQITERIGMFNIMGFIDDTFTQESYEKYPVRRFTEVKDGIQIAMGVGDVFARENIYIATIARKLPFSTLVDPEAFMAHGATIGWGSVLFPKCAVSTNVELGNLVSVNYGASISHRSKVGDYSNVAPNATICGDCIIGKRVFVGAGAVIREKTIVADNVLIGAGAVVVKDITTPGTYVGNPARLLTKRSKT